MIFGTYKLVVSMAALSLDDVLDIIADVASMHHFV